jgi:DNA-binding CsgD family transcriptional regulator
MFDGYLDDRPSGELAATERQLEALRYTSHGLQEHECADAMGISVNTVKKDLLRARRNLRAKNTTHAVAIALRLRLID